MESDIFENILRIILAIIFFGCVFVGGTLLFNEKPVTRTGWFKSLQSTGSIASFTRFIMFTGFAAVLVILGSIIIPMLSSWLANAVQYYNYNEFKDSAWFIKLAIFIGIGIYIEYLYNNKLEKRLVDAQTIKIIIYSGIGEDGKPSKYYTKEFTTFNKGYTNPQGHAFVKAYHRDMNKIRKLEILGETEYRPQVNSAIDGDEVV